MPKTKQEKREESEARQEARAKRSDQDQIQRLDTMFGKGCGAKRERARLSK